MKEHFIHFSFTPTPQALENNFKSSFDNAIYFVLAYFKKRGYKLCSFAPFNSILFTKKNIDTNSWKEEENIINKDLSPSLSYLITVSKESYIHGYSESIIPHLELHVIFNDLNEEDIKNFLSFKF